MSKPYLPHPRPFECRSSEADVLCFWAGYYLVANAGRNPMDGVDALAPLGRLALDCLLDRLQTEGLPLVDAARRTLPVIQPHIELFSRVPR